MEQKVCIRWLQMIQATVRLQRGHICMDIFGALISYPPASYSVFNEGEKGGNWDFLEMVYNFTGVVWNIFLMIMSFLQYILGLLVCTRCCRLVSPFSSPWITTVNSGNIKKAAMKELWKAAY